MSARRKQRQQTLDLYQRAIQSFGDRHPNPVKRQYYSVGAVPNLFKAPLTWIDERRAMRLELQVGQQLVVAEVHFPKPSGGRVKLTAKCSCSPGQENVTCGHTMMATLRLRTFLSQGMTPAVEEMLSGCDPTPIDNLMHTLDTVLRAKIAEQTAVSDDSIEEKPSRVMFRVTMTGGYWGSSVAVSIQEQTTLKNGGWSKGKNLNWQNVREKAGLFRTTQERAALQLAYDYFGWTRNDPYAFTYNPRSYSYDAPSGWQVLRALQGARNVTRTETPDVPLDVTSGDVGFGADLTETGMRLSVLCGGEIIPSDARCFVDQRNGIVFFTDQRLWLIPVTDRQLQEVVEEMHDVRIEVPRDQSNSVVQRLAKLSEFTRVQLPDELRLGDITADARTYLELVPGPSSGLFVRMRVRPEENGSLLFPGDRKNGQYVVSKEGFSKLLRDPDGETQQAARIVDELQLSQFPRVTDWDWRINSDDETLDFLARLKDRQDLRRAAVGVAVKEAEGSRTRKSSGCDDISETGDSSSRSLTTLAIDSSSTTAALSPADGVSESEVRRIVALAKSAGVTENEVRSLTTSSTADAATVPNISEMPTAVADPLGDLAGNSSSEDLVVLWPKGASMRVTSEITPAALRIEIEEHNDWFGINGTIEVDGKQIPLLDLLSAMKSGRQYISLGGGLWARISQEFQKRLAGLQDVSHADHGRLQVDFTAAPVLNDLFDTQINLKACQAWRDVLKRLDESREIDPHPPISLSAELRDYQIEGFRWLKRMATWGAGACLADDMGLGKTVQALALLIERMEEGPTLVVAPTSVGFNWLRESARFAPSINAVAYRDSNRDELLESVRAGDLVVVSYALLQRDFDKFEQVEWGTLVLDESQAVKNAATKTARAVRDLNAKWRLALTGTPIENHLGELWSLFRVLNPGLFGSWDRFRERFGNPIERHKDTDRRSALSRLVRPFILRRTKDEVLRELPERTEIEVEVELSDAERKRYEDARLKILAEIAGLAPSAAGKDHRFQVLAGLMKLRQLACHPALQDSKWKKSSAKLDALLELVEELREEGHKALVFSQFTQHLALVRAALDDREIAYQYLDGATPPKQRQQAVDAFQNGESDLFLISLKAGGTGLNLTAADYVIHLDPWWNPAVEDQATDRAHRIGQTRPVTVYRLVAKETIEEKILALHDRKRELVAGILEGSDQAGKLSTDDLIDLIRSGGTATSPPAKRSREKATKR